MADNHTPERRSYNMSRIRSRNTRPEELVRKYLFAKGFRYRKNVVKLPGKPDIVLPKYHAVVFVNGCFWHKHDCSSFVWPKTNVDYWTSKINGNVERDRINQTKLKELGWHVFTVWECELKKDCFEDTMCCLIEGIKKGTSANE